MSKRKKKPNINVQIQEDGDASRRAMQELDAAEQTARDPLATAAEAAFIRAVNASSVTGDGLAVPHYQDLERIWKAIEPFLAAPTAEPPTARDGIFGPSDDDIVKAWREAQVWNVPLAETPRQNDLESARRFLRAVGGAALRPPTSETRPAALVSDSGYVVRHTHLYACQGGCNLPVHDCRPLATSETPDPLPLAANELEAPDPLTFSEEYRRGWYAALRAARGSE